MEDPSDAVYPKGAINNLPDEVFVLILMLLPFPDQVRVRRVSKYWKTAVHYLLRKQEKVCISLQGQVRYGMEVHDWELDSLGFHFESGINILITHPPESHIIRVYEKRKYSPECPEKRQAVTRFCSAVDFAVLHLPETRIAEISWGIQYRKSDVLFLSYEESIVDAYRKDDFDRMLEACNKFALRFQNQLLCFMCPMFELTSAFCFPLMQHVTLRSVNQDIRDMFQSFTPKLVSLLIGRASRGWDYLHADNLKHLPANFRCIHLLQIFHEWYANDELPDYHELVLCRKAIQSIRCAVLTETQKPNDFRLPNLRFLQLRVWGWNMGENILTVNAAGLQHLRFYHVVPYRLIRFPSHVVFHNLQSLMITCSSNTLLDILSRTSHRLTQLIVLSCYVTRRSSFFQRLAEIRFLTVLQIECLLCSDPVAVDDVPLEDISVEDWVLKLLRGGSRSTLKLFWFGTSSHLAGNIETEAIAAELRLMQESESLEVGGVNKKLLTAEKRQPIHPDHAFNPATKNNSFPAFSSSY